MNEQQLEYAEKLDEPSLVGSSIRSADDSIHNNYIHPEKYKSSKEKKKKKKSTVGKSSAGLYTLSIATSLDDLMSEGALLGSDDFDGFLDAEGHVKNEVKYEPATEKEEIDPNDTRESLQDFLKSDPNVSLQDFLNDPEENKEAETSFKSLAPPPVDSGSPIAAGTSSFYAQDDYSTPNLSEYQLENQINSHLDLLSNIKSHDPKKLPKAKESGTEKASGLDPGVAAVPDSGLTGITRDAVLDEVTKPEASEEGLDIPTDLTDGDSIHTPYFHTERDRSRSRSAPSNVRSNERSLSRSAKPHLARGDSYKNTHIEDPATYELPPLLSEDIAEEVDDRRSRQSRPTMGEQIAEAEAAKPNFASERLTKDPSLLTTGDYTNFNVDTPASALPLAARLYATRSESSTNYLRTISRSRSRAPKEDHHDDPEELAKEGALVNDDPYTTVDHLDEMVELVLHLDSPRHPLAESTGQDFKVADVSDEEVNEAEAKEDVETAGAEKIEAEARSVHTKEGNEATSESPVHSKEIENTTAESPVHSKEIENATAESPVHSKEIATNATAESPVHSKEIETNATAESPVQAIETKGAEHATESSIKVDELEQDEPKEDVSHEIADVKEKPTEESEGVTTKDPKEDDVLELQAKQDLKKADVDLTEESGTKSTEPTKEVDLNEHAVLEHVEPVNTGVEHLKTDEVEPVEHHKIEEAPVVTEEAEIEKRVKDEETDKEIIPEVEPKEASEEAEPELAVEPETELKDAVKEGDDDVGEVGAESKAISDDGAEPFAEANESKDVSNVAEVEVETKEPVSKGLFGAIAGAASLVAASATAALYNTPETTSTERTTPSEDDDLDYVSPEEIRAHLKAQPVYLFTSLAGGMQIRSRTNLLSTILNANGVKYTSRDLGTDDDAKKIWRRVSGGKPLPGVIRGDDYVGNFAEIEEANEEGYLEELLYETM